MVQRHRSLVFCLFLMASVAALAQTSYVFQLPGQTGITKQIVGLGDNNFSRSVSVVNGPSGALKVLATPNGSKFYILSSGGIFSASSTLTGISALGAVSGAAKAAEISPDGKYLLVIADHFYILNTATSNLQVQADTGVPTGATPIGVVVSHDAQTAWVVSNTTSGSTVTSVNLKTLEVGATSLNLSSAALSMVLSPRGLLYVTANSRVYEIDTTSLTVTTFGQISVPGPTGPLQFAPDGNAAYFLNRTPCTSCSPIFKLEVSSHSISSLVTPSDGSSPPSIDQVLVAGNDRVFGWSSATTTLWSITPSPLALTAAVIGALPVSSVVAVAVSNEIPSARYLYLLIADHNFYRVRLDNNGIDATASLDPANGTTLSFVPIPAQSGAASLFQVNASQTVVSGASAVLIGQVLDAVGRPVFGVPATFTDATGKVTIPSPSIVTTAGGWAQTTVTAPIVSGTYAVTLTVGSLSSTFQITVGGGSSGGSGSPTPHISIVSGDGQLLKQNDSTISTGLPLVVKVTDANGSPVANVSVTFQVTEGPLASTVSPGTFTTGTDGLAKADFFSSPITATYVLSKVTATAATYGSVEFYETIHNAKANDAQPPNYDNLVPLLKNLSIPQGGLLPEGISLRTYAAKDSLPIPNISLMLADPANINSPSPVASCQGSSRGDNAGISRCDVLATCQLPTGIYSAVVRIGGGGLVQDSLALLVNITFTPGTASLLAPVSGDNQTGNPGNSFTLAARVTDGCGQPSAFSGLTWTILQGSAILDQSQNSSDSSGRVSTRVTFGSVPGPVRIQVAGPKLTPIIFNLTNQVLVSGIFLVSGGGQSVVVGNPFPNPVIFIIRDITNNPAAGLLVTFSSTGTGATFNPASATTNAQGQVQTTVTAGATPGDIFLTATHKTFTATANLSSHLPGPQITSASFTNAASGVVGLTPCGLVTVTGNGIAPTFQGTVTGSGFTVQGLSITANNVPAPILSVSNVNGVQTANFQAPCELVPGASTVVVTVNGVTTSVSGVPVFAAQPGIFVVDAVKKYGWVIRAANGNLVSTSNPARQGERLYMIVTGLGQVSPAAITNVPGTGFQSVNLSVGVLINSTGVPVPSVRYAAGLLGAYLVEFQIPANFPVGLDQSLEVGAVLSDNSTIAISQKLALPSVIAP